MKSFIKTYYFHFHSSLHRHISSLALISHSVECIVCKIYLEFPPTYGALIWQMKCESKSPLWGNSFFLHFSLSLSFLFLLWFFYVHFLSAFASTCTARAQLTVDFMLWHSFAMVCWLSHSRDFRVLTGQRFVENSRDSCDSSILLFNLWSTLRRIHMELWSTWDLKWKPLGEN